MRAYAAFTAKEFTEYTRTYKLLVIGLVFLLFGISSPLAAKFMPEIISQFLPAGIEITITEPAALDSWMQFLKNISQIGAFVLFILLSGIMAGEYSRGTLIHILTKGLSRKTVILSKFTAAALLWTGAYLLCFGVAYGYTWYFWRKTVNTPGLAEAITALWVFGILLTAITVLGGVLVRSSYGTLLFTGALVVIQILLNMLPDVQDYNPIQLANGGTPLMQGQLESGSLIKPMIVAAAGIAICIIAACAAFNKKKL